MIDVPEQITLDQWDERYAALSARGSKEPWYGGRLSRHAREGDTRLERLAFDNSKEALDLWNFLLTEDDRLSTARRDGKKIIGTMKDLGTVPVMVYSLPGLVAFYPDGAWWIPCVMESNSGLLEIADRLGIDDSFCPVRAMLGAFVAGNHFPIPDLLVCSAGSTCDDFSAIAGRVEGLGYPVLWWEVPNRREAEPHETPVELPGGSNASIEQITFVRGELTRVREAVSEAGGVELTDRMLAEGISKANEIRRCLDELRETVFTARIAPLPALELLVAEMMAIHYCSDRDEVLAVLTALLGLVKKREAAGAGYFGEEAVRIFWINPVADIKVMNLLEECGGRICGTEYLFTHALDRIPTDIPPMDALARMALADPMVGPGSGRAGRICRDIERFGAEAVLISKIPGASHCALEGAVITQAVRAVFDMPVIEVEVPSISDTLQMSIKTRLCALVETARANRIKGANYALCGS